MGIPTTMHDAKSTEGEFTLPAGAVVIDSKGQKHLMKKIVLRELRGREEDIIAEEDRAFMDKLLTVVSSCTIKLIDDDGNELDDKKRIEKVVRSMAMGDITACMFYLRIVTAGKEFTQKITCTNPRCKVGALRNSFSWTAKFDLLEDFPIKPCKNDPLQDVYEYTSTRGTVVTWSYMTGEARMKYENNNRGGDRATAALMMRVRTVNGDPSTLEVLKDLSMLDRREIRDHMVKQEGGIDDTIEATCTHCGYEFKTSLDVSGFDFFFPSETLED